MMKAQAKLKSGIFIILIVAFFVAINLTGFSKNIKNFFYSISSPIQKNLWVGGGNVSDFFSGIFNANNLKKENEDLKNKNQEQMAQIADLQNLKQENETLRNALQIGLKKDFKLVFADIIGKDISGDFILINKGISEGLALDMPVITEQKVLMGRISEVYAKFSRIMLVTDKKSSFDAEIPDSETYGVIKGRGNFNLSFELIPNDSQLKEGDLITTASLGGVFPEGILVGTVKSVIKNDVESFQKAEINPAFDIRSINNLFIITNF